MRLTNPKAVSRERLLMADMRPEAADQAGRRAARPRPNAMRSIPVPQYRRPSSKGRPVADFGQLDFDTEKQT